MSSTSFQVYNASAGSGKTHTLVKEYLTILLTDDVLHPFKHILAVTFTNKAVHEMKERILLHLNAFSEETVLQDPSPMFTALCDALHIDADTLRKRARKVLKHILHNYAFFDVVTIDTFNHRILKTFAYDLRLPSNFEVALDTGLLLEEAVDNLIYKAGEDELLTKTLVDFAVEKADDDKSWDIALDLKKTAQLLLEEAHYEHLEQLKGKSLHDFRKLNTDLRAEIRKEEAKLRAGAEAVLHQIEAQQLETSDFLRGTLPNHFKKIAAGELSRLYDNKLGENLAEGKVYTKSLSAAKAERIDALLPELTVAYHQLKKAVFHLKFLQNFYRNTVPLSLLNSIKNELETIKEEQNLVLISEFNSIISKTIAKQPAPFIYERLGEKYRHYFIDEFQDTSRMQWENLKPLIGNALESETLYGKRGTLCVVGDAKQAIYRWRGGKPEQFMNLYRDHNPFYVEKEVISLPRNYRSFDAVVNFNNEFFKHIASLFTHPDHFDLYHNKSAQETNAKKGGAVTLAFMDKETANEEGYCEQVLNYIQQATAQGFSYSDICILTRKRKEGVQVARYLSEQGIRIVSSETLLLKNSPKINFLIHVIRFSLHPNNKEYRMQLLHFLAENKNVGEKHDFFVSFLDDFDALLKNYGFDTATFLQLPFFDAVEYAINAFDIADASDAYLQFFLDEVMDFITRNNGGLSGFLEYWEKKKDTLSITAPKSPDAVQIMTIHKAKGLEFPVVIYPFANTNIYDERNPKLWLPVDENTYGIPNALLNKNKDLRELSDDVAGTYDTLQSKLELDQFNILYVVLTRAVERLYIITKKDVNNKGEEKLNYFSGLFIHYLKEKSLWNAEETEYVFGETEKKSVAKKTEIYTTTIPFLSRPVVKNRFAIVARAGALWDTSKAAATEKGRLIRYLLSKMRYASDVDEVVETAFHEGTLTLQQKKEYRNRLNSVIQHKMLSDYYTSAYTIYNEREIYSRSGVVIQPDRIAIKNDKAIIIMYKTGVFTTDDATQLQRNAGILEEMELTVTGKLLVVINDTVEVITV